MVELDRFLALAIDLADAAGEAIRPYFRQPLAVDDKPDRSPVTAADRAAETAMRQLIARRFPTHGIIGEEFGREREEAEFVWVLDPIDGTKSFISGVPLFGTLIALAHQGRPILGIIEQPINSLFPIFVGVLNVVIVFVLDKEAKLILQFDSKCLVVV